MSVKAGQTVTHQFSTYDRNGNGADFDSAAAATLVRNGVDTAVAISIDSVGDVDATNGLHSISFTLPSGGSAYTSGDRLQVRVDCTVDGAEGPGFVWEDIVDNLAADVTVAGIADELANVTVNIVGHVTPGGTISLVQGDDYTGDLAIDITLSAQALDLTGSTLKYLLAAGSATVEVDATCGNPGTSAQLVQLTPTAAKTAALGIDSNGQWQLQAVYTVGSKPKVIASGKLVNTRRLAVPA